MIRRFPSAAPDGGHPLWVDLLNATPEEAATVEKETGHRVPDRDALSEIESSSRAYVDAGAVYLSMPLITPTDDGPVLMPVGFIIATDVLITVRFAPAKAFDAVEGAIEGSGGPGAPSDTFARLLEAMVDRAADRLENAGAELDVVSRRIFGNEAPKGSKVSANDRLKGELRRIGQAGDRLSMVRDSLLGLNRITGFIAETPSPAIGQDVLHRLGAVRSDIASLNSYEEHLSSKVQFLLDATLGFISIEQNDVVKILTVVSVVGVPPVLIAGIYGMNFKRIPEYDWAFGYPYSLILMAVSAAVPYALFKWRKWL